MSLTHIWPNLGFRENAIKTQKSYKLWLLIARDEITAYFIYNFCLDIGTEIARDWQKTKDTFIKYYILNLRESLAQSLDKLYVSWKGQCSTYLSPKT